MMALGMYLLIRLADLIHLGRVLKLFFWLVISFYFSTIVLCLYCFGNPLDKVMVALIAGTNTKETSEFFQTYITPSLQVFYYLTVFIVFVLFVWLTSRQYRKPSGKLLKGLGLCMLGGCFCLGFSFYTLPGRIEGIIRTEQKNLANYLLHPEMTEIRDSHPDIIMIVIGESFSKSHSSLYGYDKPTNPRLSSLRDNGQLMLFQKVTASDTHTSEAFKYFMTTFRHDSPDKDWFRYLTLPEALQVSGYHTAWFSNQARTGWYDNVTSSFANLCDTIHFTSVTGEGEQDSRPDGIVLKCVQDYMRSFGQEGRQAVFVHLMGQHVNFRQRYPASYDHFKEEHYPSCQESQREDFATYDNATLYNDDIVASIFATLKGRNAIAIYFPDHGLDFYESSPDYCSHANTSKQASIEAALKIPFVIYTTESFRSTHPDVMSQLEQAAQRPFNTEDLPELLLSIAGYQVVR